MKKITKAVIPVAGFGTRFLPVTKSVPKEMLPIVDKPVVHYVVEELVAAGITDIIFVTSPDKKAIKDYFSPQPELEAWLEKTGKSRELGEIRKITNLANFTYINQEGPYGNGTPVLNTRHLIGKDEAFVVTWGDEFFQNPQNLPVKQLLDTYEKYQSPVICVIETDDEGTNRYAIIEGDEVEKSVYKVSNIIEKPGPAKTSSHIGVVWGYVLTPGIFDVLQETPVRKGELWLADAIGNYSKKHSLYAKKVDGKYYDVGTKANWFKTNLAFGLANDIIGEDIKRYLGKLRV